MRTLRAAAQPRRSSSITTTGAARWTGRRWGGLAGRARRGRRRLSPGAGRRSSTWSCAATRGCWSARVRLGDDDLRPGLSDPPAGADRARPAPPLPTTATSRASTVPRPPWTRRPAGRVRAPLSLPLPAHPPDRVRACVGAIRRPRPGSSCATCPGARCWAGAARRRSQPAAALPRRIGLAHVLSRPCVEAVAAAAGTAPDLVRHYRRALLPTESFAQTRCCTPRRACA